MHKSTDLDNLVALEEVAPRGVGTCSDTPIVILRGGSGGNDATCEDPATSADEVERQAQHARAANGLGDVATIDTSAYARPTNYSPHQAAHAHPSFTLGEIIGEIIVAAIQAAGAIALRALARHRQRRQARAIYDALRQLDDRTLRDLGFDRSEIASVVAEATGAAERTRERALRTSQVFRAFVERDPA